MYLISPPVLCGCEMVSVILGKESDCAFLETGCWQKIFVPEEEGCIWLEKFNVAYIHNIAHQLVLDWYDQEICYGLES